MSNATIDARVAVYDEAVKTGSPRYGRRGKPGVISAAQAAAQALGLKTATPIVRALYAVEHEDALAALERKNRRRVEREMAERWRFKISADRRRFADSVGRAADRVAQLPVAAPRATLGETSIDAYRQSGYAGRSLDPAERARAHIDDLAATTLLQASSRRAARRGMSEGARERMEIDETVAKSAIAAAGVLAPRGAAQIAVTLDRMRALPTGHSLALLFARKKIDAEQFARAVEFRSLAEWATAAPVGSIDFTREKVDGGKVGFALPCGHDGRAYLQDVARKLGERGYAFLVAVVVRGLRPVDGARLAGIVVTATRERDADAVATTRLCEVLDGLGSALIWS